MNGRHKGQQTAGHSHLGMRRFLRGGKGSCLAKEMGFAASSASVSSFSFGSACFGFLGLICFVGMGNL